MWGNSISHLSRESKATYLSSELLVNLEQGFLKIIYFPSYMVYCKYWLVEHLMIIILKRFVNGAKITKRYKSFCGITPLTQHPYLLIEIRQPFYDLKKEQILVLRKVSLTKIKVIMINVMQRNFKVVIILEQTGELYTHVHWERNPWQVIQPLSFVQTVLFTSGPQGM